MTIGSESSDVRGGESGDNLPRFSVVIPAFNEESYLPRLLDTLEVARERYAGGPGDIEVIVADNTSTDCTSEIASSRGCRVVRVEKRAIAAARNGGARVARGQVLAFVDADTLVHPDTFNAIDQAMRSPKYVGGATGVQMERMSPGIAAAYVMLIPLVWLTGMDTGVVFCRREDFEAVGGYNESRLFAEDVEFLLGLRKLGRRRGQKLVRLKPVKAITSTRKFDKHGEWHYLRMVILGLFCILFRPSAVERMARAYWYDEPR
ncbi:MAG: glycosyltransferase [Candidatus Hydrogenedentes bacterium]|nr:glycosyltransferase [Candidatus Hydrogenedentota bacterium]